MKSTITQIAAYFIALLLLVSAWNHIGNSYLFLGDIDGYRLLSETQAKWLAMLLPFFQLNLAVSLLTMKHSKAIFALCSLLFAAFLLAQLSALFRGLDISCGCFGKSTTSIGFKSMLPGIVGLILSLAALAVTSSNSSDEVTP
jgi:hypothetical protein